MKGPWGGGEWRRVAVYGLGLSGLAAARLLRSLGAEVVGLDRRPTAELDLGELAADAAFAARLGSEPEAPPEGVDGVVVSPGVPPDRPLLAEARRRGIPVIAEVELAFPFLKGPVVAITGSNGKSTTTALTGALLASQGFAAVVCGNIGVPLSSCVAGPAGRIFVTELSSFQLEGVVTLRPRAAALLNVTPDHLDRHRGMGSYAAAKAAVFARQTADDVAVLNADDPLVAGLAVAARHRVFSRRGPVADGCYLDAGRVLEAGAGAPERELFRTGDLPLAGVHNLENAMAAALLARAMGAEPARLREGLAGFRGLPHRLERIGERAGVVFYDDSKGTNTGATVKSLEGFPDGSVHLILGGLGKGTDPRDLREAVASKARRLYLIGQTAAEFARALGDLAPFEMAGTLDRAVAAAAERAAPGEIVLLSPACASFDQYRNYSERGEHFRRLVAALEGEDLGQEAPV